MAKKNRKVGSSVSGGLGLLSKKPKESDARLQTFFETLSTELSNVEKSTEEVAFAIERQQVRARKKAIYSNRSDLETAAIDRFLSVNEAVSKVVISLDPDVCSNSRHFIRCVLEDYTTMVRDYCVQIDLDRLHLFDLWGFGPGASVGTRSTHTVDKMYEPWTCTSSALNLALQLRRNHPYLYFHDKVMGDINCVLVPGSKLTTVPKNEERNRTIAVEPLANMSLQLAAGRYIEGALRRIGLDIRKQQPLNKEAARRGSQDGSLATIDLKDASDMFNPELVRLLLPDDWFKLLMDLRSPVTNIAGRGEFKLNMISTMGNGFTFPMMTLILLSLIYGVLCKRNLTKPRFIDWDKVCVFGDDIIVSTDIYEDVCTTIESAGLIVNRDKSFAQGPFRESCGGDYFKGYDVTPFYIRSLKADHEVYIAINSVLEWTARHKVSLPKTLDLLIGYIDGPKLLVPEWSNPDNGIRTTLVDPRYRENHPATMRRQLVNTQLAMPLVVGGFVIPDVPGPSLNLFYSPRQYKAKRVVKKMRLPKGYLDGRDPLTRSPSVSHSIDLELIIRGLTRF